MPDINRLEDRTILIESKVRQIEKILESDDITYGIAKTIIQKVEEDFLRGGDTFLESSKFKNVSPFMAIDHPDMTEDEFNRLSKKCLKSQEKIKF